MNCAAVIPCLNEENSIGEMVIRVRQMVPAVFVVDDGSDDTTQAKAAQAGAQVIRHTRNQGKGAALRTGLKKASESGFEWALLMDGDGQHATRDIPAFFRAAKETGARLVVGNRMHNPVEMPWVRRWVNRWMSRRL